MNESNAQLESQPIKHTCSLGTLCHAAEALKRSQVRRCSYPFDWVFTDPKTISSCLSDNFKDFLNSDFYGEPVTRWGPHQSGHALYDPDCSHLQPSESFCFFFHKDPREKKHHEYYVRCVERFRRMLDSKEKKLFFSVVAPHQTRHPKKMFEIIKHGGNEEEFVLETQREFLELEETVKKHTENYTVLVAIILPGKQKNQFKEKRINNLEFLEIHTISNSQGANFILEEDNIYLDQIIKKRYNFELED